MIEPNPNSRAHASRQRLRLRYWLLLPSLGLLTVGAVAGSSELIARAFFADSQDESACVIWADPVNGPHGIPNTVCPMKIPEGPLVQSRFNNRGDYDEEDAGPKSAGVFRIVMFGSSFVIGQGVAQKDTFGTLLPEELTRRTGRQIQLYSDAFPRRSARVYTRRMKDTLTLKPDMILWVLTYADVRTASIVSPDDDVAGFEKTDIYNDRNAEPGTRFWKKHAERFREKFLSLEHAVNDLWHSSRSSIMLNHLMAAMESQDQFLARNRVNEAQYLNAVPSQERLQHLAEFDTYFREIMSQAKSAGVPVVAVLLPTRLGAAFLSSGHWPPTIDPYSLDNELRAIVTGDGGTYLDILPYYRNIPEAEHYYYPADTHPNSAGHALIATLLAKQLSSGAIPFLISAPGLDNLALQAR